MAVTLRGRLATSQFGAMEGKSSRELQARNYLEKHRIMELLTYLTSALLFSRPGKCLAYHSAFCPIPSSPQKFPV